MKNYFRLQIKITNRKIDHFGLSPFWAYLLVVFLFCLSSFYLFYKLSFAPYIYVLMSISFLSKLSKKKRNEFLKTMSATKKFYVKLRLVENFIISFPFIFFLIYKQEFLFVLLLFFFSILGVFFNVKDNFSFTIPTPFTKKPFEFLVGFRRTFYLIFITYFLVFQSIVAQNFNLGIFSVLLLGVVVLSYYSKIENEFFIWIFRLSPKQFLLQKIKIAIFHFIILILPVFISLGICFSDELFNLALFFLLFCLYLITAIFAKYSNYPNEIHFPSAFFMGISFVIPPLILIAIPFFYNKSEQKLKLILADD